MAIKLNIILAFLLFGGIANGQRNRLPDWSLSAYEWKKNSIKRNRFYLKPHQKKIRLELCDNTFVLTDKTSSILKTTGIPDSYINYSNNGSMQQGSYQTDDGKIIIHLSDSGKLIKKRNDNNIYFSNTKKVLVLKRKLKNRIALSYQYGSETNLLLFPPLKFTYDAFPVLGYYVFFGFDTSINLLGTIWGHLGTHIGYQHKFLVLQTDIDYTFVETGGIFTLNPKVGFILNGLFFKIGPGLKLSDSTVSDAIEGFNYWEVSGIPINIEVGYYLKLKN